MVNSLPLPLRIGNGMVAPTLLKFGGMSASPVPIFHPNIQPRVAPGGDLKIFKIRRSLLPLLGLLAVQDKINHVSIQPLYKMTEIQYQQNIRFSRQLWHIHK
jgi:hypothetical protein